MEKNSKKSALAIVKSLYKHGIKIGKCMNYKGRPHNNNSGVKFKKVARK